MVSCHHTPAIVTILLSTILKTSLSHSFPSHHDLEKKKHEELDIDTPPKTEPITIPKTEPIDIPPKKKHTKRHPPPPHFPTKFGTHRNEPKKPKSKNTHVKSVHPKKFTKTARLNPTTRTRRRHLENQQLNTDISSYTIRYETCQTVSSYSAELAQENNPKSILKTQRFIVFRLCPTASADTCHYDFGEYVVSMDLFLKYALEYRDEEREGMCELCKEYCQNNNGGRRNLFEQKVLGRTLNQKTISDCTTCIEACTAIENMQENGYEDAANYVECQQIREGGNEDDAAPSVYVGAVCDNNGASITIGVFSDEECTIREEDLVVEDVLVDEEDRNDDLEAIGVKMDYSLLRSTYDNDDPVICEDDGEEEGNNGNNGMVTKEICSNVYEASGKCEITHGFEHGIDNTYYNNNNNNNNQNEEQNPYTNQVENEELVCDFVTSLKSGTYQSDGSIRLNGSGSSHHGGNNKGSSRDTINPAPTDEQKLALTFLVVGTAVLAIYAALLHYRLGKDKETKPELMSRGGALV